MSEKALALMGKIKKAKWKAITEAITEAKEFTESGGVGGLTNQVADAVKLQLEDYLSPLTNEITTMVNTAMQPFLDKLAIVVNDLTAFIGEGAEGALIGGVIGGVAALFLPGGPILMAIGAIVGAAIQQFLDSTLFAELTARHEELTTYKDALGGFWADIGTMWSGFWRDLGWK